jgi:hypothetical protein
MKPLRVLHECNSMEPLKQKEFGSGAAMVGC